MMNKTESIWCPLPWTHIGIKNNGSLRMCSHSKDKNGINTELYNNGNLLTINDLSNDILNCDTLREVRKDFMNGRFSDQCIRCKTESAAGNNSRNVWETTRHLNTFTKQDAINMTDKSGYITNPHLVSLDLRIGNLCNLRCVMCFPGESTRWYSDYEEIYGNNTFNVDNKTYTLDKKGTDFNWINSNEKIQNIIQSAAKINKIKFGGGEPILIKQHQTLLELLIENEYSKNIELEYSISLSALPQVIVDLWSHFRKILLCVSIDGYNKVNEAIRYPSNWGTIESHLDMLDNSNDNIEIFTSTTLSLLNIEHFSEYMIWLRLKNFKKINKHVNSVCASHPVLYPRYLSLGILEPEYQQEIFDKLKQDLKDYPEELKKIEYYDRLYHEYVSNDVDKYRSEFSRKFYKFKKLQNQDWESLFPYAFKMVKRWEEL